MDRCAAGELVEDDKIRAAKFKTVARKFINKENEMESTGIKETWEHPEPDDQVSTVEFGAAVDLVSETNDPIEVVKILSPFLYKAVDFKYEPVEYSPKTGEPVKYDWKPITVCDFGVWNGRLTFSDYGGWNMPRAIGEKTELHKLLSKKRHILVPLNGHNYLLSYISGTSDRDGDSPAQLELSEV